MNNGITACHPDFVTEWTFYAIKDRTGVRYVGITSRPLQKRAYQHLHSRSNPGKVKWMRRSKRKVHEIGRVVCERRFAMLLEKRLSKSYLNSGARLLNREARGR